MKKTFLFYLIALISTSLFLTLQLYDPPIIREHLEGKAFDLRLDSNWGLAIGDGFILLKKRDFLLALIGISVSTVIDCRV